MRYTCSCGSTAIKRLTLDWSMMMANITPLALEISPTGGYAAHADRRTPKYAGTTEVDDPLGVAEGIAVATLGGLLCWLGIYLLVIA